MHATEAATLALPTEGECDAYGDSEDPREIHCLPSCQTALAFAARATTPAMRDVWTYENGFVRLTKADGSEPSPDEELSMADAVVELLKLSRRYEDDPRFGRIISWYTRWSATGGPPAGVIYAAYESVDEHAVGDANDAKEHPLIRTAQFLDTPVGCMQNPLRDDSVATDQPGPGAPSVPDDQEPPSATGDWTPDDAAALFVELVNTACEHTESPPDPTHAWAVEMDDGAFMVTDGNGTQLRLDVDARIVTSLAGPDELIPRNYSFCDHRVFVGLADH